MPDFALNYSVTDDQLRQFGLSERVIELAKQPFLRQGGVDFDVPYALAVWDARDDVALAALAINNPQAKHVFFPPHAPYRGRVRPD